MCKHFRHRSFTDWLNDKILYFSACKGVENGFYFQSLGLCPSMTGDSLKIYESQGLTGYTWDEAVQVCESKNMKLASPQTDKDFYTLFWNWKKHIAEKHPSKI